MTGWVRRHPALTAFAAGALVTLGALGAVAFFVLSDQRRTARLVAAGLSRALAREVRIERVIEASPARVVMRGVAVSRDAGWPVDAVADTVEATGPLLATARGEPGPVRVTVMRPSVTLPPPAGGDWLPWLESTRQALAALLGSPYLAEVSLVGGRARRSDGSVEFDLAVRKGAGEATADLTLRQPQGAPLALGVAARAEGEGTRLDVRAQGRLAPLLAWLGAQDTTALGDWPLAMMLEATLGPGERLAARGGASLGDAIAVHGEVALADATVRATLSRGVADLGLVARMAGLAWAPTGRAELDELTVTWRPDGGGPPLVRAALRLPALTLPAAGVGREVKAHGIEGRLALDPAESGTVLSGELRAARVEAAGLELAPAEARYRVRLDPRWTPARADLDGLRARLAGVTFEGRLGYDATTRRLDGELAGAVLDAADLLGWLAPGWLGPADRVRLSGPRLTVTGLDPALGAGSVRLEARRVAAQRPDAELASGRLVARADLEPSALRLALDAESLAFALAGSRGELPRVVATAELDRAADGAVRARRADLAAQDREGREVFQAELRPAPREGWLAVSAGAPALERLDWLWPELRREVKGSARLDVEVGGAGLAEADGRVALTISEAELLDGKLSVRDLTADLPLRRGLDAAAEPPWGTVEIGELIGYGLVVRDVTTPARVWKGRLSLNDLTYALYSGTGRGWTEVDVEPSGLRVRGKLDGAEVRIEEFMGAYGIRGGTMTGLARFGLGYEYRAGRLELTGRFEVPRGGTVNIELLNRLLGYAEKDPTGFVLRQALENLRTFDYKSAEAEVRTGPRGILIGLTLLGREGFFLFPGRVAAIRITPMPLSELARQFPGG